MIDGCFIFTSMKKRDTIKRSWVLLRYIERHPYATFKELEAHLSNLDFILSKRTLQRDFQALRDTFEVSIEYDSNRRGYYIDKESSFNLDSFMHFLEMAHTSHVLMENLRASKNMLNYLSFESDDITTGSEHLATFLEAVSNGYEVEFTHENYFTDKRKAHIIKPMHMREYQNRWYVRGLIENGDSRTFGLDRIFNPKHTGKTFDRNLSVDYKQEFSEVVGVNYSESELSEVIIRLTPFQAKYVESLRLHPSQEVIERMPEFVRVRLRVRPNYELIQKILMLGDGAILEAPEFFVNRLKGVVNNMAKNYQIEN